MTAHEAERIAEQIVAEWIDGYEPPLLSDEAPALVKAIAAALAAERGRCCDVLERMKPAGGRAWTPEQLACFSALTDAQAAIRSFPAPPASTEAE